MANGSVVLLDGPNSHKLELVERAWYAAPGVAMLALTPELLPHLESCIRQAEYAYGKTPHVQKMREAIAAAQNAELVS